MKKNIIVLIVSLLFFYSCSDDDKNNDEVIADFDQSALLVNWSSNIIVPAYKAFETSTLELNVAIDSFSKQPNLNNLKLSQLKLKTAYTKWQSISFLEFGPAESKGLKSNVNIFPTDQNLIEQNIQNNNTNVDALSNKVAKGFPALDYLLHSKNDSLILNDFQNQNRRTYLKALVNNLHQYASTIANEWNTYQNTFISSTGTDVGSATGMLVNALNQHYERFFRDGKIGIPLGVRSSGVAKEDHSESFFGGYSFDLINTNYYAMKNLYLGSNGIGLDDYLVATDAADVNQVIQNQFVVIENKLNQFSESVPYAIKNQNQMLGETYQEIQKLIVYWKVDMPSRLGILITYQDNDGD